MWAMNPGWATLFANTSREQRSSSPIQGNQIFPGHGARDYFSPCHNYRILNLLSQTAFGIHCPSVTAHSVLGYRRGPRTANQLKVCTWSAWVVQWVKYPALGLGWGCDLRDLISGPLHGAWDRAHTQRRVCLRLSHPLPLLPCPHPLSLSKQIN